MERKIISKRIGSILDDLSRLNNALYAMDTTDIQRYPDNYEVLSMDAALRAESVACRLRHLIYASTGIKKAEYLATAQTAHGIEISYLDGVLEVSLPSLLPKRRQRKTLNFCWTRFTLHWNSTQEKIRCPNSRNAWSALPRSTTRLYPQGGCGTMTIWRKNSFWTYSPRLL